MGRVLNLADPERFRILGNRIAWAFVPYVAICQAVQLAFPIPGARWMTFEVIALLLIVTVTSPWWWRRRHELGRATRLALVGFTALIAYALVTLAVRDAPLTSVDDGDLVPKIYIAVPLLTAVLTMLAGIGIVLTAERRQRLKIMAAAGASSLLVAFVGWPFQSAYRGYVRLATGQGGAAIIHVMFLLIAAFALAYALKQERARFSYLVVLGALFAILATQSRGAILDVGAWVVLVALGWLVAHPKDLRKLLPVGVALVAIIVAVFFIPSFSRLLSLSDHWRETNLESALGIWTSDVSTILFGTGSGQVWPWYAFESGLAPGQDPMLRPVGDGQVLITPHSTPLVILVELGIPGVLLALAVVAALVFAWWRARTSLPRLVVASATLACLVAFLVDTYLVRNFSISLWWWASLALTSTWDETRATQRPALATASRTA